MRDVPVETVEPERDVDDITPSVWKLNRDDSRAEINEPHTGAAGVCQRPHSAHRTIWQRAEDLL